VWTTDLKDRRIRVNAVSPGAIDTPGLGNLLASAEAAGQRKIMISNAVPLGRRGTPDELAKAVVFLASDDSSYVTGTELFCGWRLRARVSRGRSWISFCRSSQRRFWIPVNTEVQQLLDSSS
jgi:NAD(P)-dependent dehydrogenase (short-subunit alcohol dehydrogenase family)